MSYKWIEKLKQKNKDKITLNHNMINDLKVIKYKYYDDKYRLSYNILYDYNNISKYYYCKSKSINLDKSNLIRLLKLIKKSNIQLTRYYTIEDDIHVFYNGHGYD